MGWDVFLKSRVKFDLQKHHRRSIRLRGYDYAQAGGYFVTICTHQRTCLFGDITDGKMELNVIGRVVAEEWTRSSKVRQEIELDEWAVMPNHLHGIVMISTSNVVGATDVGAHGRAPLLQRNSQSLGSFIAGFKSAVTTRINRLRDTPRAPIWQRNYYEHIIRTERELDVIREYIHNNPLKWSLDLDNPVNFAKRPPPEMVEGYLRDVGLSD